MNNFQREVNERIIATKSNSKLRAAADDFLISSIESRYSYNFSWQGRPIIQYPQDIVAIQEVIWQVKPDLIIETGIAHGGSLILSASMLAQLDLCDAILSRDKIDPSISRRKVLGIDIDIRPHNLAAIEEHPMASRIQMLIGSSVDPAVQDQVKEIAKKYNRIMVFLDSNHTRDHVFAELNIYAPLVSVNSYCIVFDTIIERLPNNLFTDRPWRNGNSPQTAVNEFLENNKDFKVCEHIDQKLLISVAPGGYLLRVK